MAFSNLVFVEIWNSPLTVSGATTIFQIASPSIVPWAITLSTVADAYPYSSVADCTIFLPIKSFGFPDTTFTLRAYTLIQSDSEALYVNSLGWYTSGLFSTSSDIIVLKINLIESSVPFAL